MITPAVTVWMVLFWVPMVIVSGSEVLELAGRTNSPGECRWAVAVAPEKDR